MHAIVFSRAATYVWYIPLPTFPMAYPTSRLMRSRNHSTIVITLALDYLSTNKSVLSTSSLIYIKQSDRNWVLFPMISHTLPRELYSYRHGGDSRSYKFNAPVIRYTHRSDIPIYSIVERMISCKRLHRVDPKTGVSVWLFLLGTLNGGLPSCSSGGKHFHGWTSHVVEQRGLDDWLSREIRAVCQDRAKGNMSEVLAI